MVTTTNTHAVTVVLKLLSNINASKHSECQKKNKVSSRLLAVCIVAMLWPDKSQKKVPMGAVPCSYTWHNDTELLIQGELLVMLNTSIGNILS